MHSYYFTGKSKLKYGDFRDNHTDQCVEYPLQQYWLPASSNIQIVPYATIQMLTLFVDFDYDQDELDERVEALTKGRSLEPEKNPFITINSLKGGSTPVMESILAT